MKKRFIPILISLLLGSAISQPLSAVSTDSVISDAQITAIRTHCSELQATLNRVRQADTLLRYDRGQLYRTIADKLMVPLNQRIASNQLDGSKLVATTAEFNLTYQEFFEAYRVYDIALNLATDVDCTRQPTTFFDRLMEARDKRETLHEASKELTKLAKQYRQEFTEFRDSQSADRDGSSEEQQ